MSKPKLRPSIGFVLLVSSYSLLIATLAWGFSVPELERVWVTMQGTQRTQFRGLSPDEENTLTLGLSHYPTLVRAFIGRATIGFAEPTRDGWVTLARSHIVRGSLSQPAFTLDIECNAPTDEYPVTVTLERAEGHQSLRFTENARQSIEIRMGTPKNPEFIPVTVIPARVSGAIQSTKIKISAKGLPSKVSP